MAKRRPGAPSKSKSLLSFLGLSLLAGLLVAGLTVPFAALAGVSGTVISTSVDALPAYLETPPEAMRTTIYLDNGEVLATLYDENREVLDSLDDISPLMRQAQIDIEDSRFYEHGAMDFQGTMRALLSNLAGGQTQGGSSITQQYVKLVRVEQAMAAQDEAAVAAAQEVSLSRKLEELKYAIAIEQNHSKDEILLRYLNLAFYGDGAYGVEAAAMHYFGRRAKDLNLPQAAMLAGLVQNPSLTPANPDTLDAAIKKRNLVLDAMLELGHVEQFLEEGLITAVGCSDQTTEEGQAACAEATRGKTTRQLAEEVVEMCKATGFDDSVMVYAGSGCVGSLYPIPCHFIEETLYEDEFFGQTRTERENNVKRGGYDVYTTLRPEFQNYAQAAIDNYADPRDPIVVTVNEVQPGTGRIWAMAQNRSQLGDDPGQTWWVQSAANKYGGSQGFQAGSTFKSFTAAAALDQGYPPTYTINSPSSKDFTGRKFPDCDGTPNADSFSGGWRVSGGGGNINMYTAAANSVNTYFAELVLRVGPCAAAKMAKAAGVERANGADIVYGDLAKRDELLAEAAQLREEAAQLRAEGDEDGAAAKEKEAGIKEVDAPGYEGFFNQPSITLGTPLVTPLSMAGAFATYGARGKACTPSIIDHIDNRDGATVKDFHLGVDNCVDNAIRPEVMDGLNAVLKNVTTNGLGTYSRLPDHRDQGTKTGTTEWNDNNWLVSYTPEISVSVMVAVDTSPDPETIAFWDKDGNGFVETYNDSRGYKNEKNLIGQVMPYSHHVMGGWSYTDPPIIFNAAVPPIIGYLPATAFTAPTTEILKGKQIPVPSCTGLAEAAKQCYEEAGFSVAKSETFSDKPEGTYLSTNCEPYRGGLCTMIYSKGPRPSADPSASPSP
ncbi:MAG: penicillin-binding protein [Propionibacteriaceae bacterium]|jgi:membrane peptidoglycan carboxypeptidase|nr:penicillin-binding protein [Propionibacteriaceae bacterium]